MVAAGVVSPVVGFLKRSGRRDTSLANTGGICNCQSGGLGEEEAMCTEMVTSRYRRRAKKLWKETPNISQVKASCRVL